MAREIYTLDYTGKDIDRILNKGDNQPFIIYHDDGAGVYRFFPDEEKMRIWVEAMLNDDMTPEIDAYQFTEPITAPAPFTINITVFNDNRPILEGTEGNTLDFSFMTTDGNGTYVPESVDVYYTFRSPAGTKNTAAVYNPGTVVHMNIDNYLSLGTNTITIMVKGRSSSTTKTVVATYNVVKLELTSTFQIARSLEANKDFDVAYTVKGDADKVVEFYIDGEFKGNELISSLEPVASKVKKLKGQPPGKHTLQIQAKMQIGDYTFKSKLLYYEFIVKGSEITTTVIAEQFPYTQDIFSGSIPGLNGEQYVIKEIEWAYYSSDYTKLNATITWRLYTEGGTETPLATRNADVVEAETDVPPEPLKFMPMESGAYHLQALIDGVIIGDYTIAVILNTSGILETTSGLTMKLSGLGRDNSEPPETLTSWSDRAYSTQFFNQPWNGNSGWLNNALVLNGGATALINNKPFAEEISPTRYNGCVFEIDFETFNVYDDDAELLRIGALDTASLVITPSKAILKSRSGRTIESRFKSDERIKVAFVIYPNNSSDYQQKVFVYNNGVMSGVINYVLADSFDIGSQEATGSTVGMINLGNADAQAGIKIYYIRTYSNYINMYEELNNYFIDSGENLQHLVDDNDIYATGTKIIDIDKLEGTITTVKFTGPLDQLINQGSGKHNATCALEVINPTDSNINLKCSKAEVSNAGQSTLDKPVPSFHVKLDKNGNVCYDRDDKPYSKNRWVFRQGNVPEKKFRLQANYMDSSGCHNGSFFRMFNEVAPKVSINNKNVLRIPSEVYASEQYPQAMRLRHGEDPSGNNWKFPYKINMVPDSIPCIVVWRPDENSSYRFLGQYVIMEEKKSNYANGMHSIYSGLDADGKADPFGFRSSKTGDKLWDNIGCHQFEFLRSTGDLELFLDDSNWNTERENAFELVYPDSDDLTPEEITAEWDKFYNDVVHPIISAYDPTNIEQAQAAFEELLYGPNPKLDRWHLAAYYCLAMRNACTDSMVRNMELVTYDGNIWLPKWWDVDMQCGLQQTGECNIVPTSDRYTLAPGSTTAFAFSGRLYIEKNGMMVLRSSWLWDALVGNTITGIPGSAQFMEDVKTMDAALYRAGWNYTSMTKLQDEGYIDAWSDSLFNESSVAKYLAYNDLPALQGDRTPHRHWFLRTSYDYFDALNVCGEYTSKLITIRTQSISPTKTITFKAASTSYFGWGFTSNIVQSGIRIEKGDIGTLTIDRTLALNDPLHIYAANKISEIDLSQIAENIAGRDIDFEGTYDDLLGSQLRKLVLGISKSRMNTGVFNTYTSATEIQGITTLSKLEYLDVQGMQFFVGMDLSATNSLKYFYAAGSGLDSFNPASGSSFIEVELPTSVTSLQMDGCKLTDSNDHCVIKWYRTVYEDEIPVRVVETTVPATIRAILLSGMGSDKGTQELIFDWLRAVNFAYGDAGLSQLQITCRNVNWTGVAVNDLLLLSKIPASSRNVTGRIKCSGTLTSEDIININNAFAPPGGTVFTNDPGIPLRVDADAGFVLGAPTEILAGNTSQITGVVFPIEGVAQTVTYRLGQYEQSQFVPRTRLTNIEGRHYYQYKDTVLYEDDGTIVTQETSEPDYSVVVEGATTSVADYATITIKRRTYPTSVDYSLYFTPGKNVSYDSALDTYYITDNDLRLVLTAYTIPAEVSGTIESEVWTLSDSIAPLVRIDTQNGNLLELYVESAGNTLSVGTIGYTRTYVDGTVRSKTMNFWFKNPVTALTTRANPELQKAIYTEGYSKNQAYSTDVELWKIQDIGFAIGGNSEETEETFIIKPTKRTNPIISGQAALEKVVGESKAWNQLVQNGDFSNGTTGWTPNGVNTISASNNILRITATGENKHVYARYYINLTNSHKYLISANVNPSVNTTGTALSYNDTTVVESVLTANTWVNLSTIFTCPDNVSDIRVYTDRRVAQPIDTVLQVKNVQLFDLTLLGIDNLTTVAEFESWLASNVGLRDYYPYNAGEIINTNLLGIKTVGFNLFNNVTGYAKLPIGTNGNTSTGTNCYQISGPYTSVTDDSGNTITPSANGFFNIDRARTISVGGGNAGTCIHLTYDGSKNGQDETYWEEITDLDVTRVYGKLDGEGNYVQVYPSGMRSAGDVHDTLTASEAVKRTELVDLSTRTIETRYTGSVNKTISLNLPYAYKKASVAILSQTYEYIGKVVGVSYLGNPDSTEVGLYTYNNDSIGADSILYIVLPVSSSITSNDVIVYSRNTPLTYTNLMYDTSVAGDGSQLVPLSEFTFRVDDWGTIEQLIPTSVSNEVTSCAANVDIIYDIPNIKHLGELNSFINLNMPELNLSNCSKLGTLTSEVDLEDNTRDYVNVLPRKSQTLLLDFEEIDMSNTHLVGVNLKPGNTLETITYSDYTEEVVISGQSALTEVNIPEACIDNLDKLVIEGCNELEEITWTN